MQFSTNGLELLKKLEGFRAKPYADSGGKMTVGYGHLIVPGDGVAVKDIINTFKAFELLEHDVKEIVGSIGATNNMTQEEFDALVISKYGH